MTKDSHSAGTQSTPTMSQDLHPVPSSWNEPSPWSPWVHSLTEEKCQQLFPMKIVKCYLNQKKMPGDWLSEEADSMGKTVHEIIKKMFWKNMNLSKKLRWVVIIEENQNKF